ncbi:Mucin-associated surface protein (MASP) [Trypanosoma cruzi]|uniref:Mucin-associated surface protein (MASP), putative n=2 Tax=Trypanosoma cruzi TaxID=5693 RepID=Q4E462_TRYCC|nr:mucin-associated surface protein (MASP), putative [Trypanosoma cruzi]EAN99561.1 mucin-associated surface protein (MASP), putative [Trypanosoma cruzi]PWV21279.1 Mucin-associated surface protein (MASP) [Trypanosoma cruzi]RNC43865.1 mucin-associated surface protein (MASP) [Trypanosoma cruzi]|eukprot:XP_821412.1 mucin-associated surface protein (MASP) [Trypanosoma cruzi strain CL Brener]
MAMMMAGRVLLVCALCVVWCGAGGRCDEGGTGGTPPGANPASGAGTTGNAAGQTAPGEAEGFSAQQPQLEKVGDSPSGGSRSQVDLQLQSPTIQLTPSGAEHTAPSTHSKPSGEQMQDLPDEGPPGKPGISPSQEEGKNKTIVNQQSNGPPSHSSNNDFVSRNSEERTEDNSGSTETLVAAPSEEGQERENVTPSLEQPQETSTAAPTVTTQTISTKPSEENKSNTVKMSAASPQSTVTANTTDTTNTQNSDGSTAASHTTSSLLLLLVVACVAAAAVVAA